MRGRPVIQWLVFLVVWCGLLIPILYVTKPRAGARETGVTQTGTIAGEPVWVSLRFSSDPASFVIRQNEQILWEEQNPAGRFFEKALPLQMQPEGLEFNVSARVSGGETALEVKVEASGYPRRQSTLWGEGDIDEAVSFSWNAHE